MSKRRNIVAELMDERCLYGGQVATRRQVYDDLAERRSPEGKPIHRLMIDRLVWMCPKYDGVPPLVE